MTAYRLFVWTFLITFLSALPLSAQLAETVPDTLTLNDVIRLALSNNPSLQRTLEDAHVSTAKVGQSRSFEFPTLDGTATCVRIDPVPEFEFGGHPLELAPHNNYDIHVAASYNIYDFGKARGQTQLSQSRTRSAVDAANVVRSNLTYAVVRAFDSMLFIQRSLIVQDQEIAALNEHLSVAQRKVEAGTAINYDVLATQVRVATVQNQRADALNALEEQRTALRELLGLPSTTPVNVKGQLTVETFGLNKDSLALVALRQRPEMQLADDAENVAKMQQRLAARSDLPVLRAAVQYGVKNGYEPNLDSWRGNWVGMAQLQVPLYNGKRRNFQEQEAAAARRAEHFKRLALERQIRGEVERQVDDVQTALNKLSISEIRIKQAQDAVNIARIRYASGTITNVDVLDAETSLVEALLEREHVVFSFEMARTALQQALGDLREPLPR
jgi:outer membrane protein TolC